MLKALRRLAVICLCVTLSLGLLAPASVNAAGMPLRSKPPSRVFRIWPGW